MVLAKKGEVQPVVRSAPKPIGEPIFLVGAERSGTTMLRLMLSHHPEIAWCNEFEYSVDLISQTQEFPQLDLYYDWLETHRIFRNTGFQIDKTLDYPQLVNSFLHQKKEQTEKAIVGATVHRHFDKLLKIWPNARFIHIVRDPRDVARSCIGMGWAGNVWTGIERWLEAERLWDNLARHIPAERRIEVQYEALIAEPTEILSRLSDFIGVAYNDAMLSYPETTTFSYPDPKLIYQWRRKMSDSEVQLVESQVGELLERRGYKPSGLPSLEVSPLMQRKLRLQDKWQRWQFRLDRYGWRLWISDYLARHLGMKTWAKDLRLQIGAIDQTYVK
ncbi:MAG TPA: sulfotransferase [Oscillatoriales cyanobacterium M59_W2019_021]|nr:MAG: sulfotransferase [Cyanobacteria bacterium J055]HIK31041.1 sulfotransferase [Oscillatoriales cyanobacterium M4454_W2019_049]HIK52685.1 sulfotransferase [Oscillatoriales cyanobacterium M59_W2019_021]